MYSSIEKVKSNADFIGLWYRDNDRMVFSSAISDRMSWEKPTEECDQIAHEAARNKSPVIRSDETQFDFTTFLLAIPILSQNVVKSVVVFRFLESMIRLTALEVWNLVEDRADLELSDGCYGHLHHFREVSKNVRFQIGIGLPGMTWKTAMPRLLQPLSTSEEFIRADDARQVGLEIGVGFPILGEHDEVQSVLLMLSPNRLTFAEEFQVWREEQDRFRMSDSLNCRNKRHPVAENHCSIKLQAVIEDLVAEAMIQQTIVVEKIPSPLLTEEERELSGIVVMPVLRGVGASSALVLLTN